VNCRTLPSAGGRNVHHGSDLTQKPSKTWTLYVALIAMSVAAFVALSRLGASLAKTAAFAPATLAPRAHAGDLFHFLLALVVIVVTSRATAELFRHVSQPPVIGEVVAGLMLGPSLLGRLAPDVSGYLLPAAVTPYLGVVAQLGVVLYMFLVGLELDTKLLRSSAHTTVAISHASIALPFLLGTVLSLWLYPELAGPAASFGVFAMFMGLSLSVTAFPVLSRILTDTGLQTGRLGAIAISCAAADDVTAWCLLAALEGMAQANSHRAIITVTLCVGYVCLMFFVLRPLIRRACLRQDALGQVSPGAVATALVGVLSSALVTELIGIHALFGAFLLGMLVPHDSLLARELVRRIKDLVMVLLLPVFFAFVGTRTQLGLIDGVGGWLTCLLIVVLACVGKVGGSAAAARFSGLNWRDAAGLGVLMNTRGLMELVVLNIGLEMRLISAKLFAMMVLMALVTTMMTSPAVRALALRESPA
jgi:Kef-type K+ transport system membrane component KefB